MAYDARTRFVVARLFVQTTRDGVMSAAAHPLRHPPCLLGRFFEGTQGGPHRALDALRLRLEQGFLVEGMTDPAPEAHQIAILQLPERAAAVRTSEPAGLPVFSLVLAHGRGRSG